MLFWCRCTARTYSASTSLQTCLGSPNRTHASTWRSQTSHARWPGSHAAQSGQRSTLPATSRDGSKGERIRGDTAGGSRRLGRANIRGRTSCRALARAHRQCRNWWHRVLLWTREISATASGSGFQEGGERDSNPRPPGPQPGALPTELPPPRSRYSVASSTGTGGTLRVRARSSGDRAADF